MNNDTISSKFTNCIFLIPDVHKMINSLSCKCLNIKIDIAKKKDNGINFGIKPKIFKKEYLKYIDTEYPLSTISSKKFTALTVSAINESPSKITKKVLNISFIKFK